jgi:RNA recognition motif-containing protein
MASKLYVGSLPYSTTKEDLEQLFAQYGTVASVAIISDRDTGQSKGFGFVEFESDDAAKAAIDALNGTDFGGRRLVVNEARPLEKRSPRDGGGGGGGNYQQR